MGWNDNKTIALVILVVCLISKIPYANCKNKTLNLTIEDIIINPFVMFLSIMLGGATPTVLDELGILKSTTSTSQYADTEFDKTKIMNMVGFLLFFYVSAVIGSIPGFIVMKLLTKNDNFIALASLIAVILDFACTLGIMYLICMYSPEIYSFCMEW